MTGVILVFAIPTIMVIATCMITARMEKNYPNEK